MSAVDELWSRGIIAPWYLRDHQAPLYNLIATTKRDIIVPNISRRFGKSTTCVTYVIEQAIKRRCDIRYATAFLTDLEGFIVPIFNDVLVTCPDDLRPRYLEVKKTFIFPNGSKIKLVGLDKNPNGIRGNAIDELIIDEAAFVRNLAYLYRSIIVPATADRQFKIIFPSTPPVEPDHFWASDLIPKAKQRGTYLEFTLDDNTHLDIKEKERLLTEIGGKESVTAQREFYCKIMRDPELVVIPEYVKERHIKRLTLPRFYKPLTTIDFDGSMDKHGIICTYYDFERAKFCVYRESLLDKNTNSGLICKTAKHLESDLEWSEVNRVGDAPEQLRIDLSSAGFSCRRPLKEKGSLEANINNVRLAFMRDEIEIDVSCKDLDMTLEFGSWVPTRQDWKRTTELGHLDLLAALLYAFKHQDRTNPFPVYWGRSMEKFEIPKAKTENFLLEDY